MKLVYSALVFAGLCSVGVGAHAALQALDDELMRDIEGQTLVNLTYTAPGASGNPNTNIGFYRMGLDADISLNANIQKLQLGCGGANGNGVCDVDIDRIRFTGFATANNIYNNAGPSTDFLLKNPYIEIAVRNPTTAATRELVGLRFGALQAAGMMSFGERPYNADGTAAATPNGNVAGHTGINRISADMDIYVNNGLVPTSLGDVTINQNSPNTGNNIFLDQYFARASTMQLAPMRGRLNTFLGNLNVTIQFNEDFRYIHSIAIGSATTPANDFYISLSKLGDNLVADTDGNTTNYAANLKPVNSTNWIKWQKLSAPTTWSPAARGWWFSLPEVRVENFTTARKTIGFADLDFMIQETNLDLQQVPVDNCYGNLTFC